MILPSDAVFSVSQLARQARIVIEKQLGSVTVEGELSNFRRPGSGHWYFTLKDANAQIRCAMFAGRNRAVQLTVTDGLQVRVSGRVSLYEPRGDFQLIAERMEAAGEGALRAAFDALKKKLAVEGLFDDAIKKPLPAYPRHLTIITSSSGAALRDVLQVIERRYPGLQVLLIPSAVQGDQAERELIRALQTAAGLKTDLVLLTRGGGSLEDLWAFNLESVARAVSACPHPVVSAIGHQTDFAITDFVADLRAPTPSAAAELITPTRADLVLDLTGYQARLRRAADQELRYLAQRVDNASIRLLDPDAAIARKTLRVEELNRRLGRAAQTQHQSRRGNLASSARSLALLAPLHKIQEHDRTVKMAQLVIGASVRAQLRERQLTLAGSVRALSAVSPLNTLNRGYAVLRGAADTGQATIGSVAQTRPGQMIDALLADGRLELQIVNVDKTPPLVAPEFDVADEIGDTAERNP